MKNIKIIMSENSKRTRVEADGKYIADVKGVEISYNSGDKPEVKLTIEADEVEVQALNPKVKKIKEKEENNGKTDA